MNREEKDPMTIPSNPMTKQYKEVEFTYIKHDI